MLQYTKFNRLIVAGLAAAAIAPTAAIASPADNGGVAAPTAAVVQDQRAPDQVDGSTVGSTLPGPPQFAVNPQPIPNRFAATTQTPSANDNGVDDGVLIAIGGGVVLLVAGIGVASRKRIQVVRQRQLA